MHRGRCARDQRHVVRAGKAGNSAIGNARKTLFHELFYVGDDAILDAALDVSGVTTINTNHHHGLAWPAVADPIEFQIFHEKFNFIQILQRRIRAETISIKVTEVMMINRIAAVSA